MRDPQVMSLGMPRPGKALLGCMGVLLGVWVLYAILLNFVGADPRIFLALTGNTEAILHGEVWRLFTAGLLHLPTGAGSVQHVLYALLGLYFLAPTLEDRWGPRRMVAFLVGASIFGYTVQFLGEWLLPSGLSHAIARDHWFGAYGAIEAVAVAWALSNRGQTVRLFFVLPVSAMGMLFFVIGVSILHILAAETSLEGGLTPFGGMLAGYLFGAGTPTPARRLLLKIRYRILARRARNARGSNPRLRVIEGGAGRPNDKKPPTDKRFLN